MYKIHTMNKISPVGLIHFDAAKYAIDALKSLKCVARAGAGVNNIPLPKCTDHGIVVFNTPGANANAVAELVLLGMLAASRPIIRGTQWEKTLIGNGDEVPKLVEKGKSQFVGPELKGNRRQRLRRSRHEYYWLRPLLERRKCKTTPSRHKSRRRYR